MAYVDGFLLTVATEKLEAYRKMSTDACAIWMEHGALDYKECVIDDDHIEGVRPFAEAADAKEGETVVFSFIVYASREHRDEVNKKVMADPRLAETCTDQKLFDCKRMAYGGFKAIVEA